MERRETNLGDRDAARREDAEALAIQALAFVAGDIRAAAREPGFLAGVLQFILAHEPTLMRFAAETGADPARVAAACRALPFGNDDHERSA